MNQDKVKELLLSIRDASLDFSVTFTGKSSRKVNGLYKPESREILIHNKNFTDDNMLLYTAIHEYAHHQHACANGGAIHGRAHTIEFWSILHGLIRDAEAKGIYQDVFESSPELQDVTRQIREKCLKEDGELALELGRLLSRAHELCQELGGRFEDYVDRVLRIPRVSARTAMGIARTPVNPALGADNMKIIAGIRDDEARSAAEQALLSGDRSPDEVRMEASRLRAPAPPDPQERLLREKQRLERTIENLKKRLNEVMRELQPE